MTKDKDDDKVEIEFEDLRSNDDPVPDNARMSLGLDEEDDTDDQDDDLTPDEKVRVSKEVRRQIMKERKKIQKDADSRIDAAKEEAGDTITKLEGRLNALETDGESKKLDEGFSEQRTALEEKLTSAMEEGETEDVVRLNREISELTAEKAVKRDRLERAKEEKKASDDEDDDNQKDKRPPRSAKAQAWMDANDWYNDPDYIDEVEYTGKVDQALQRAGWTPDDPEFYDKLNEKLAEKFPDLDLSDDFEDEDEITFERKGKKTKRRSSPVGRGDTGAKGSRRKGRKITKLTTAHLNNMRVFGMDPENPEHLESYMAEVQRTADGEARR